MAAENLDPITQQVIDALQRDELSGDELIQLQENLAQLGHFSSNTFPSFGPKTGEAVISFLNDNSELTYLVNDSVTNRLNALGYRDEVSTLMFGSASHAPEEYLLPIYNQINSILSYSDRMQSADIRQLTTDISRLGIGSGDISSRMTSQVAQDITQYLSHNPAAFDIVSTRTLQTLIRNDQHSELKVFAEQNPEIVNRAIQETLEEIDGNYQTTPWQNMIRLQTLLAVGDYNDPSNIDGNIGSQTRGAIERYSENNPDAVIPEEKAPEVQRPVFDLGGQPGPYTTTVDGDNGYGVPNVAIERAWSDITDRDVNSNLPVVPSGRPLIVIDLGHGVDLIGNNRLDQGAVSRLGLSETDFIDHIAHDLAKSLYEEGFDVAFTRNPDEQLRIDMDDGITSNRRLDLRARPEFAHNLAEQLGATNVTFISLHANSAPTSINNGAEIYVQQNTVGEIYADASGDLATSIAGSYRIDYDTPTDVVPASFTVLRNFERDVPWQHRDTFSASLVEFGYLSNPGDTLDLLSIMADPEQAVNDLTQGITRHIYNKDPSFDPTDPSLSIRNINQEDARLHTPFTTAALHQQDIQPTAGQQDTVQTGIENDGVDDPDKNGNEIFRP